MLHLYFFPLCFLFSFQKDLYRKLKFVRYGTVQGYNTYKEVKYYTALELAKSPHPDNTLDGRKYQEVLQTADLIFAPVHSLPKLYK